MHEGLLPKRGERARTLLAEPLITNDSTKTLYIEQLGMYALSRCPRFDQEEEVRQVIFAVLTPAAMSRWMEGRSGQFLSLLRLHLLILVVGTLEIVPLCLLGVLVRAQFVINITGLIQVTCGVI